MGVEQAGKQLLAKWLCYLQGEPWIKIVVLGQSFMLHQIRKMVGLAVAMILGIAPKHAIAVALRPQVTVITPIAPDVGLFLDESIFDSYNTKWADRDMKVGLAGLEDTVTQFKARKTLPQELLLLRACYSAMQHKESRMLIDMESFGSSAHSCSLDLKNGIHCDIRIYGRIILEGSSHSALMILIKNLIACIE